ncbi:MAG: hypothetical protein JST47_16225 [Bacteroidetes bacterium]|nr:hypothetical protein [Bacteroidota bacterium]MBS1975432.1 hypothetical protein [Bacteroidota bacterium]
MRTTFTIIILALSSLKLLAQTNNSPYSILGIGDIEDSYFNRTSGMANTGIAYRSGRYLINNNPASFSALDDGFFAGEVGGKAKLVNYYGSNVSVSDNQSFDITFRKLVFGIKAARHWGTSVGIVPFSSQNYEFNSPLLIGGTNGESVNQYFNGSGGLNKVYWANSYEFFKHLSLGVSASYLFGSLQQKIILQNTSTLGEYVSTTNTAGLSNFYLDYGMQLHGKISKKLDYAIGATFANKTSLNVDLSQTVLNADSVTLYQSTFPSGKFSLPVSYGAGLAITYNKKYTFLADYRRQDWSSVKSSEYVNSIFNVGGYNYYLQNSERFSAGFEISKQRVVSMGQFNALVELMYFQGGFYYNNTYLNVFGQRIRDIGGTIGIGVNSKRTPLSYTLSLQYGIKGVQSIQLIQERYAAMTIAISYRDFWLTKGRKFF